MRQSARGPGTQPAHYTSIMDNTLKMSTRDEAQATVRALVGAWGSEFVVSTVVEAAQETNDKFNLSTVERLRVWNGLHNLIPRGR